MSDNTSTDNLLKQLIDVTKEQKNLLSELKDLSNKPKIIDEIVMVLAAITLFSTLVMIYISIYGNNQLMWIITVIFALMAMVLLYLRLFLDYCRYK